MIILGTSDLNDTRENVVRAEIQEFIVNPNYDANSKGYDGDVAIVVLKEELKFSDFIQPVCMHPESNPVENYVGKTGSFVGFGNIDDNLEEIGPFRESLMPIVSQIKCITSDFEYFDKIKDKKNFCAGKNDGKSGPCNLDYGSGLYQKDYEQWTLLGTVSHVLNKEDKCDLTKYAVFTDVSVYSSWINEILGKH